MRSSPSTPVLAALALLGAVPAFAATPVLAADGAPTVEPKFNIMGPATCADWPKSGSISSAGKAVPLNWTLGFLSGWAALGKLQLLDVIDPEAVDKWMGDYCAANPTVTIPLAARELERDLEAKLPPPPAPATSPMFVNPAPAATPAPAKPKAPAARKPAPRRTR